MEKEKKLICSLFERVKSSDESILWQGKPKTPTVKIVSVAVCIVWFCMSFLFVGMLALKSATFLLCLLPVILIGLLLVKLTCSMSPKLYYCVTDRKLVIVNNGKVQIKNLSEVRAITLKKNTDKYGNLVFEEDFISDKDNNLHVRSPYGSFQFTNIKDYVTVYNIVSQARYRVRQQSKETD